MFRLPPVVHVSEGKLVQVGSGNTSPDAQGTFWYWWLCDNYCRTISPLICQSSFLFLSPSNARYPTQQCLQKNWPHNEFFPQLPVNTTKCNFEPCTQLSSRWLNQESRPGTPDAAVRSKTSLSVSRQPQVIEQRKIFCVDFYKASVFRPTQLSKVQKVSGEISKRMCRG